MNDRTLQVQRFCRSICEDPEYRESILQRARTNQLGTMEPVVWAYAWGKPKESLDLHVQIEDLSQLSTEELALRAEDLLRKLHEAQDAQQRLAPYIEVEVLKPKSLSPADIIEDAESSDGAVEVVRACEVRATSPTACPVSTAPSLAEDV